MAKLWSQSAPSYHLESPIASQKEVLSETDEVDMDVKAREIRGELPLFAIINDAVFVVHGGLFHDVNAKLSYLWNYAVVAVELCCRSTRN